MIAIYAVEQLPEFSFSMFNEDPELCMKESVSAIPAFALRPDLKSRTVELYLSISACIYSFEDVVEECICIFERCDSVSVPIYG